MLVDGFLLSIIKEPMRLAITEGGKVGRRMSGEAEEKFKVKAK